MNEVKRPAWWASPKHRPCTLDIIDVREIHQKKGTSWCSSNKGGTFFDMGRGAARGLKILGTRSGTSALRTRCLGGMPGLYFSLTRGTRLDYRAEKESL